MLFRITSWNFKALVLPTRLRESDVFLFRRSLSKGLPEVGFEIALNESFQKCQKWPKPKLITPYIKSRPLAVLELWISNPCFCKASTKLTLVYTRFFWTLKDFLSQCLLSEKTYKETIPSILTTKDGEVEVILS